MPKKNLLLFVYYWPPAGGPGVQRWLKMTNYLVELNWNVTVITTAPEFANYPQTDVSLLGDVHPEIKVIRTKTWNPYALLERLKGKKKMPAGTFSEPQHGRWKFRMLTAIRSHLFIPDPRRGWNRYAIAAAEKELASRPYDLVLTSSPPHSTQLIGLHLKKKYGVKWVMDMRDPWTDIYYYQHLGHSILSSSLDSYYERSCIKNSDAVFTVGLRLKELMDAKAASFTNAPRVYVVTNGYDEKDFGQVEREESSSFRIVYTGTLSTLYRYEPLFDAISNCTNHLQNVEFEIYGAIPADIQRDISNRIQGVKFLGVASHSMIAQVQKNADLLLLLIADVPGAQSILSGKVFEYLRSGNTILNLAPRDGDAAKIIDACDAGRTFERNQQPEMEQFIKECYEQHQAGIKRPTNVALSQQYSRENLAKKVAKAFDEITRTD